MAASVSGFYAGKDSMTLTFYIQSSIPPSLQVGKTVLNLPGISGTTRITALNLFQGVYPEYGAFNGSFDFQVDKEQSIQGITPVSVATLSDPPFFQIPDQYTLSGTYFASAGKLFFFSSVPLPPKIRRGWLVKNIPGAQGDFVLTSAQPYQGANPRLKFYAGAFVIEPAISGSSLPKVPNSGVVINNQGLLTPPEFPTGFVPRLVNITIPQILIAPPIEDDTFPRFPVDIRDLNDYPPGHQNLPDVNFTEKKRLGFSAGGVLSLDAIGPQEQYVSTTTDFKGSQWSPEYEQYTSSVVYQQRVPVPGTSFIQRIEPGRGVVELRPTELGDLFANMHLQVTLPALPSGNFYTNQIGRALIEKVEFIVNETVVETIYDDWLVIRDQTFLDYDEQVGMFNLVNGGQANQNLSPTTPLNLLIPLEFFFCRRHSAQNKGRERLRRPYFPVCAMWAQKIYIRFTFRPQNWFTNWSGTVDLINPLLIIETVRLSDAERIYYRGQPLRYIVPTIKKESTAEYNQGTVTASLTANFPVQLLAWFIRNKNYEGVQNSNFYDVRYLYGYASQFITTAVPLTFPSGSTQFIDSIQSVKITMNNVDVLDTFANGLYCSFKQPMEHGLSVPQKNIYLYSFGLNVTEYNQGGYIDFSKLNSQTSNITLKFLPELAATITQYSLYLFYYGYSVLEFQGGFARLAYL